MLENNEIKRYRPKDIRSPFLGLILVAIIIAGIKIIFTGYSQVSLQKYLILSIMMFCGICVASYLLYANFVHCIYVETTDDKITGKNLLKIKRGTWKFNEIKEIWITKKSVHIIFLKDLNGKRLSIHFRKEFFPLLNEILEKAVNCEKVDIKYDYFSKQRLFSDISQVKANLDKLEKRIG